FRPPGQIPAEVHHLGRRRGLREAALLGDRRQFGLGQGPCAAQSGQSHGGQRSEYHRSPFGNYRPSLIACRASTISFSNSSFLGRSVGTPPSGTSRPATQATALISTWRKE